MSQSWTVLEHTRLEQLEENLWQVEGTVPRLPLRRRMTVVRLADGSLVVHNAIALEEEQQRALEALGSVRYVVVPNPWHRLDAPAYAARYPDAKILCPRPATKRVEKVVRVDGTLAALPADPALASEPLEGSSIGEHALVVRSGARATIVFGDSVMNNPKLPGVKGWLYGLTGSTSNDENGRPLVTPLAKLAMVRDKAALRTHLTRLSSLTGLTRVIPGHGLLATDAVSAPRLLEAAAASL